VTSMNENFIKISRAVVIHNVPAFFTVQYWLENLTQMWRVNKSSAKLGNMPRIHTP